MPDASAAGPNPLLQFVPLVVLFCIFYFLLIRPQQKKQKEHADTLSKLAKNDEVITTGGVHATVILVGEKTVTVRIADNVKIEIEKNSIQTVTRKA
jgi:preprotein translocase subunit YajC